MINLMKADIYRIFRGKGIYITLVFLLALCFLQTFGFRESIGINSSSMDTLYGAAPQLTGQMSPLIMMRSTDNLMYMLLPVIIFIASVDFSSGTVKNVLTNGISRTNYYFSKLILSMLFCAGIFLFSLVAQTIIVTLFKGFGGAVDGDLISQVIKMFSLQLFLLLTVTSIGMFFVFATKSTSKVKGLYIAFCLVPMLVIVMLSGISGKFIKLLYYEMVMNIRMAANFNAMTSGEIVRIILVGVVYLSISIVGSLLLFRKCDIK